MDDNEGCQWWIEVASGNPEPDSYQDTVKTVACGAPVVGERPLCEHHTWMLEMPESEFEALVEGRDR